MTVDDIVALVENFDGTLTLRPSNGDGSPELAWGDLFFYYSPDGTVPSVGQPFATVITKNYPDDDVSRLDRPGAFRVNISVGKDEFRTRTGYSVRDVGSMTPSTPDDTVSIHPTYGSAAWLCVVNPGPESAGAVRELIDGAYRTAKSRYERKESR